MKDLNDNFLQGLPLPAATNSCTHLRTACCGARVPTDICMMLWCTLLQQTDMCAWLCVSVCSSFSVFLVLVFTQWVDVIISLEPCHYTATWSVYLQHEERCQLTALDEMTSTHTRACVTVWVLRMTQMDWFFYWELQFCHSLSSFRVCSTFYLERAFEA